MWTRRERGYSLIELLIVVGLLMLIAAIAVPSYDDNSDALLDLAATEVAAAIRYAHAEAIRSGEPHGLTVNMSSQLIRLYRLDESVNPPVVRYDVRNPLTKQLYELSFGAGSLVAEITAYYFKFDGLFFSQSLIGFAGGSGVPKFNDSGTIRMLENGYVRVGLADMEHTVSVSPMTGRVTIQ